MKNYFFAMLTLLFSMFFSLPLLAAEPSPQSRAESELTLVKGKPLPRASDVRVDGMLTLKDNYQKLQAKRLDWRVGLALNSQSFSGSKQYLGNDYRVGSGTKWIPTLSIGPSWRITTDLENLWLVSLTASAGYVSMNSQINNSFSGNVATRLSSTVFELQPELSWKKNRGSILMGAGLGRSAMVQSSKDSAAQWTESTSYSLASLGAAYDLSEKYAVFYKISSLSQVNANSDLQLERQNQILGATVTW